LKSFEFRHGETHRDGLQLTEAHYDEAGRGRPVVTMDKAREIGGIDQDLEGLGSVFVCERDRVKCSGHLDVI
jgi:hypothetical protein